MASTSDTSTPDDYERKYMGAADALVRERVRMAWWGHFIFLFALAAAVYAAIVEGRLLGVAIVLPLWVLFMTLRTTVTRSHINIQLGLLGPKIPIENVTSAEAVQGSLLRAGWGVRIGFDGTITFSVPAEARDYVRIAYLRRGKSRTEQVMSANPSRIVRAIDAARAQRHAGVRVATATPVALDAAEAAEGDADNTMADASKSHR